MQHKSQHQHFIVAGIAAEMEGANPQGLCQFGPFGSLMSAQEWRCLVKAQNPLVGLYYSQQQVEGLPLLAPHQVPGWNDDYEFPSDEG